MLACQSGHIELFLLSEVSLVELDKQNQPYESRSKEDKARRIDGYETAPPADKNCNDKEDNAENQRYNCYEFCRS